MNHLELQAKTSTPHLVTAEASTLISDRLSHTGITCNVTFECHVKLLQYVGVCTMLDGSIMGLGVAGQEASPVPQRALESLHNAGASQDTVWGEGSSSRDMYIPATERQRMRQHPNPMHAHGGPGAADERMFYGELDDGSSRGSVPASGGVSGGVSGGGGGAPPPPLLMSIGTDAEATLSGMGHPSSFTGGASYLGDMQPPPSPLGGPHVRSPSMDPLPEEPQGDGVTGNPVAPPPLSPAGLGGFSHGRSASMSNISRGLSASSLTGHSRSANPLGYLRNPPSERGAYLFAFKYLTLKCYLVKCTS